MQPYQKLSNIAQGNKHPVTDALLRYVIKHLGSSDETGGQGAVRTDCCIDDEGFPHSAVTGESLDFRCS